MPNLPKAALGTVLAAALLPAGIAAAPVGEATPRPEFSFTAADAAKGAQAYATSCASCHGAKLEGGNGPMLKGAEFLARWTDGKQTYEALYEAVRRMPKQAPGSLPAGDYAASLAFILSQNGYGTGTVAAAALNGLQSPILPPTGADAGPNEAEHATVKLPRLPESVAASVGSAPTDAEMIAPAAGDWLMYNRTYKGDRTSPLAQITPANAGQVQPVCMLQLGVSGAFQGSPLVYQGNGYILAGNSIVAFDPTTCQRRWQYKYTPKDPEGFRSNRGIAIYDGKIYRGTSDAHLIAVDAATGKLLWDARLADGSYGYSVGAAPVVYKGKVIVGLTGGDFGAPGRVFAIDARTGAVAWTFETIDRASWKMGGETGGGASWTTVSVDPADGLVYVPIGNPAPDFVIESRPGDNLYTNSVVALDAGTGKLRWYVQQRPGDFHDWDTTAAPALYEQDGKRYMAVGTKAGYVYIYDRDRRKLISRTEVVPHENEGVYTPGKPLRVCPGISGGVEWNGPAYDPRSRALFVNSIAWCTIITSEAQPYRKGAPFMAGKIQFEPQSAARGWTRSLDAASGKEIWAQEMPLPMPGAITPTAGGVVFTGGANGDFLTLDSATGKTLYRFHTGGEITGGVITYEVAGKQYVAVASGGYGLMPYGIGGSPTVVVFALKP